MKNMTQDQFDAMTKLLRVREGRTRNAMELYFVRKIPVPEVAKMLDVDYRTAYYAVQRAKNGLELAKKATGAK